LLLDGGNDDLPEGWGLPDGDDKDGVDMEITFTPGLSEAKDGHETTLEKYQRKLKEKKKKRKNQGKQEVVEDSKEPVHDDDFFDGGSGEELEVELGAGRAHKADDMKDRIKSERGRADLGLLSRPLATPEELALIVASDNPNKEPKHFDLKSVLKSERKSKGKRKKNDKYEESNETQEDFVMDVKDERFKVLYEDHTFAVDPTSPQCVHMFTTFKCLHTQNLYYTSFRKTKGMAALLKERSKWQKELRDDGTNTVPTKTSATDLGVNLKSLVESVKRKTANLEHSGAGKRRKL
jgi:hypothetical protein